MAISFYFTLSSRVHVQIMQDCYIGIHMPLWFTASIPTFIYIRCFSPCYLSPTSLPPVPSLAPPTDPSLWCSPPCVHVFSLFNTCLWVRTCSVWLSVLVSVCWELWFPDSSMSLQGHKLIIFYGCIIFHSVYVPHFPCPVYHRWAFGLVPDLCYCKQCHNEHMSL